MPISTEDQDKIKRKKVVRVRKGYPVNIPIMGEKDPRGPDNNVIIYIDKDDTLRIRVWKTDRCYKFVRVEETQGYVEVIAK